MIVRYSNLFNSLLFHYSSACFCWKMIKSDSANIWNPNLTSKFIKRKKIIILLSMRECNLCFSKRNTKWWLIVNCDRWGQSHIPFCSIHFFVAWKCWMKLIRDIGLIFRSRRWASSWCVNLFGRSEKFLKSDFIPNWSLATTLVLSSNDHH